MSAVNAGWCAEVWVAPRGWACPHCDSPFHSVNPGARRIRHHGGYRTLISHREPHINRQDYQHDLSASHYRSRGSGCGSCCRHGYGGQRSLTVYELPRMHVPAAVPGLPDRHMQGIWRNAQRIGR
jgi:hypothetical protein